MTNNPQLSQTLVSSKISEKHDQHLNGDNFRIVFSDFWSKVHSTVVAKHSSSCDGDNAGDDESDCTKSSPKSVIMNSHIEPPPLEQIPSLASVSISDSVDKSLRDCKRTNPKSILRYRTRCHRSQHSPPSNQKYTLRFDPVVCKMSYGSLSGQRTRSKNEWYTNFEINTFRAESVRLIHKCGTFCPERKNYIDNKPSYCYPALKVTQGDIFLPEESIGLQKLLMIHVKLILVVEPRQNLIDVYVRSLKGIFPHASIATATTATEALNLTKTNSNLNGIATPIFDIIIAEERLGSNIQCHSCRGKIKKQKRNGVLTGSEVLQSINCHSKNLNDTHKQLLIGTSSFLSEDCSKLRKGGADIFWGNPLPVFDLSLRNMLLIELLKKRGQENLVIG